MKQKDISYESSTVKKLIFLYPDFAPKTNSSHICKIHSNNQSASLGPNQLLLLFAWGKDQEADLEMKCKWMTDLIHTVIAFGKFKESLRTRKQWTR